MFLLEKRNLAETDIITNILKSENIPYKLKAIRQERALMSSCLLGYDIEIHSDLQHFDYAKQLIKKRFDDINLLESIYNQESHIQDYSQNGVKIFADEITKEVEKALKCKIIIPNVEITNPPKKKSLLKKFLEKLKYFSEKSDI